MKHMVWGWLQMQDNFNLHQDKKELDLSEYEPLELGLLHHSDRGSQYASKEYRNHIDIMKIEQSMSRKISIS
jgi:transposase InsO family protein